jgi:hypothetical protein
MRYAEHPQFHYAEINYGILVCESR